MPISISGSGVVTGLSTGNSNIGKILQVVTSQYTTSFSTSSQSWTDMGISALITPSSTSSRIIVSLNGNCALGSTTNTVLFNFVRNSTNIGQPSSGSVPSTFNFFATDNGSVPINFSWIDSPQTTSPITYKVQWRTDAAFTAYFLRHVGGTDYNTVGSFTLMEIAA